MKSAIKSLLLRVGLAPAGQVERLTSEARQAAGKVEHLEDRLVKVRADVESWKRRYEESAHAAGEWKQAASRADAKAERAAADAERAESRGDEWKKRVEALTAQVRELRARLDEARRATTTAQEHLMATEVKLDLVEAAVQVLDVRTRDTATVPSAEKLHT